MRATVVWVNRLLWSFIAIAVVTLGAIVSLGRHYIDYVDDYQQQIVDTVSQRTGLHIQVKHLSASWVRISPQFVVDNLRIFNPAKPDEAVIRVEHLVVRVGLFQSLSHLGPVFSFVEGRGASAQFDEVQPGQWLLRGFAGGGSLEPLIDGLLRIHRADIRGSEAKLSFIDGRSAQLDAQSVQLQRSGRFRRLNLQLRVAETGAPLRVIVEARGDPRRQRSFNARAYAEFAKVDLTPLLPMARSFGFDLTHGRIDGAAWLDWLPGGNVTARGRLAVPTLDLAGLTGRELPPMQQISMPFLLQKRADNLQLFLPRIRAQWAGESIDIASVLIARHGDEPVFTLALPQLSLEHIHRVLRSGKVLSDDNEKIFAELAPRGEVRNLQLHLPAAPGHTDLLRVRAEIADLQVSPWQGAPGISGMQAFVDTGIHSGSVVLNGSNTQLDFPHVYRQPIPFTTLCGALRWRLDGERVLVDSGPLEATSDAGTAAVSLGLNLNTHAGDPIPPQMTLVVGMRNSAAQFRDRFIPYTLAPSLLEWLQRAIGSGKLPRGGFIYHGSLRTGDHDHRTVQLFLELQDGELAYHADWPALHHLNADVWLDDADLDVLARNARIFDHVDVRDIEVAMRPQSQSSSGEWLTVTGAVLADGNDLLRVLRESALRQRFSNALDSWSWQGTATADLALGIPIGGEHNIQPEIRVDARLGPGAMTFGDLGFTLEQVSGPLSYRSQPRAGEQNGLYSPGIDGRLWGRAAAIKINTGKIAATDAAAANTNAINVRVAGKVAISDLRDWLQQPLLDYAHGETGYKVNVAIDGDASTVNASSNLSGVVVELPPPYAKTATEILPLALTMPLHGDRRLFLSAGNWADLRLNWVSKSDAAVVDTHAGNLPAANSATTNPATARASATNAPATNAAVAGGRAMHVANSYLDSGVLRLGQTGSRAAVPGKFIITGQVPALDFEPWRELLATHRTQAALPSSTEAAPALAITLRDLTTPELSIVGQTLRDVHVSGSHVATENATGWLLQTQAVTLKGDILIADAAEQALRLNFAELHLPPAPTVEPGAPEMPSALSTIDPAKTIAADVRIKQLWRGDENWGDLAFRLRPVNSGLRLDQLNGTLRGIAIQPAVAAPAANSPATNNPAAIKSISKPAQLTWLRHGDVHTTQFSGRLAVNNLADVLERWGFERSITSSDGHVDADVSWSGAPDAIGLKKLDGAGTVRINDGQFLKASGSASGALKIVGVFNFANLLRRLQLDFSDVFKGGVSFDSIEGQLGLHRGVIDTLTPVDINSPSSHFRVSGNIDFNTDLTDMELVATLPLATNLPWFVALAGGLPAAAGVYVASKLFQEQVDHFSSAVYEIHGTWREPEVKFRRIFDDQLPKRAAPTQTQSPAGNGVENNPAAEPSISEPPATELPNQE